MAKTFDAETELLALYQIAEDVLMAWLECESPADRRRQAALSCLADAGALLNSALRNLRPSKED